MPYLTPHLPSKNATRHLYVRF